MKVLHVTPSFHPAYVYGGPTRSVYELCSALAGSGCEVTVLTTDANGPGRVLDVDTTREVLLGEGFSVRYCHRIVDVSASPSLLRQLIGYVRECDVVHLTAVYSFTTIPALLAAKLLRKPLVWSTRGMLQRWSGTTRPLMKSVWERVCRLAAPTNMMLHFTSEPEQEQSLERFKGFDSIVIPNCVPTPSITERTKSEGILNLLYIGRLDPIKGLENLIDACGILNRDPAMSDWTLSIAGSGDLSYTNSLETRVADLGLADRVTFLGAVDGDRKARAFADSSVVVVPSQVENFGMVVAEALAHGVPVIASKGTPWQRVEEVGCGFWVDNSPESLANAVKETASSPLAEMGAKGRHWIEHEFSPERAAAQTTELYRNLINRQAYQRTLRQRDKVRGITGLETEPAARALDNGGIDSLLSLGDGVTQRGLGPKDNSVSAIILTKNEQLNIASCLSSLSEWTASVYVVDSGSTDETVDICREFGASVFVHEFETHSKQWQWALNNLPIDSEWVIGLDADQSVTPELRQEIIEFTRGSALSDPSIAGAYLNRRQIFRGKWIRHGGYYPKHLLKLFRRGTAFADPDDLVDHHFRVAGKTITLRHDLIEDNKNEADISVWISKHNRYARLQAQEEYWRKTATVQPGLRANAFGSPDERTLWLKSLWARCPLYARPVIYFVYRYIFRLGFLDGKQGFIFHFLQAFWYRLLVDIHLDELRNVGRAGRAAGENAAGRKEVESTHHLPEAESIGGAP